MKSSIFGDDAENFVPPMRTDPPALRRFAEQQLPPRPPPQQPSAQSTYQPVYTDYQPQFQEYHQPKMPYIEEIQIEQGIPSLSAFPNYRFDIAQPEDTSDIGIQKRAPSQHSIKAAKIELHALEDLQALRDEMAKQSMMISERMKLLVADEPLRINNDHLVQQFEQRNIKSQLGVQQNAPEILTRTEFLFPDGSSQANTGTGM